MAAVIEVKSPEHFKDLLSQDLNRVSVIDFWAAFAEPCKQMNEVFGQLAKKHGAGLFLSVDAEEQSDIAESFDIEAVPSFIILRGHTLLGRINGADAPALTNAVAKNLAAPTHTALSRTDQAPAAPPSSFTALQEEETPEQLEQRLRGLMNQSKVVLFMKGSPDQPRCGFSRKIVGLLRDEKVDFTSFDILTDESVRQGLKKLNDWPTYPQLIVKGELVGGLDIVQEMIGSGELASTINSA